ncbi:PHP domain-containing protein, partial [bacterium]|nr:PHP domain-containing protein [bacterium]
MFTHLHTHSHYSLLDGLPKIDDLVAKAKEYKMDSLALTDHGVMYGVIEFYQKCVEAGIKPIIGIEAYMAPNSRHDKQGKFDKDYNHLILLAENNTGYQNLLKLTTQAHLEGFYYKPRVDWELLEKYHEGIIAMTACLGGAVPKAILNNENVEEVIDKHIKVFGRDNFFLELQHHPEEEKQQKVN